LFRGFSFSLFVFSEGVRENPARAPSPSPFGIALPSQGGERILRGALSGVCRGRTPSLPPSPKEKERKRRGAPTLHIRVARRALKDSRGNPRTPRRVCLSVNDPSAGSPTETLLRLLLPLNGKVQPTSFDPATRLPGSRAGRAPRASPDRSIGRSDGRCVQRAGT